MKRPKKRKSSSQLLATKKRVRKRTLVICSTIFIVIASFLYLQAFDDQIKMSKGLEWAKTHPANSAGAPFRSFDRPEQMNYNRDVPSDDPFRSKLLAPLRNGSYRRGAATTFPMLSGARFHQ